VATTFSRTTRALAADGFRGWAVAMALATVALLAWTVWLLAATVARLEVSEDARVEVEQAVRGIEPVVEGRIATTHLVLGRVVQEGDVLVELDATPQTLELGETRSRLDALGPEIARLQSEIAAETRALDETVAAARNGLDQARAQSREAAATAALARQDADRLRQLHGDGIVSDAEYQRAMSEAERRLAAAEALALQVSRVGGEQQAAESERRGRIERLERSVARLEGERGTLAATIERLRNEIDRRTVRAIAGGTVADVAPVAAGTFVQTGARLGTIIPAGGERLKVVAHFRPSESLGHLRSGQAARIRLDAFPWMQYGSVEGRVSDVAGEVRDGLVRVDVAIDTDPAPSIPLQHGLPGVVEIEVERLSPAALVLRAAGQMLVRPVRSATEQAPAS